MKRADVERAPLHPQTAAQGNDELQRAIDADAAQTAAENAAQNAAAQPDLAALAHPSHEELAEAAAQPVVLPGLYRNGRLIVPAPLKGSHEVLVHQNLMADNEGLERIVDDGDLARLRASHDLVNFPESASLHVNPELAADRRCARVWTVRFATDIARQYYARFHQPLQVNSAARTIAYQLHLQRTNGNAVGVGGDRVDARVPKAADGRRKARCGGGVPAGLLPHQRVPELPTCGAEAAEDGCSDVADAQKALNAKLAKGAKFRKASFAKLCAKTWRPLRSRLLHGGGVNPHRRRVGCLHVCGEAGDGDGVEVGGGQ
jgi:hypothetical protein